MKEQDKIKTAEGGDMEKKTIKDSVTTANGYEIRKGTEVYYTGDMANLDGFGRVTKIWSTRFGTFMTIRIEDGRVFGGISVNNFDGPGRRFMTRKEYKESRERKIREMQASLKGMAA